MFNKSITKVFALVVMTTLATSCILDKDYPMDETTECVFPSDSSKTLRRLDSGAVVDKLPTGE